MAAYLFAVGCVGLLGQVVILRELIVFSFGVELIYTLAMGIWLFWTAVGAMLGPSRRKPGVAALRWVFAAFALLLPSCLLFVRYARTLFGAIPGAYLAFGTQLLVSILALLPLGVLLGVAFQWAAKQYVSQKGTLARAYAVESLGAMAGGSLAVLLSWAGVQNVVLAFGCSLLGVLFVLLIPPANGKRPSWALAGLAMLFCVALSTASKIDFATTRLNHPFLIASRDSPYGRISIAGRHGQFAVFENGALAFETESIDAEIFVHLAAQHRPASESVLIVGGGVEGILSEVMKYRPRRVDYIERNPMMLELVDAHLPAAYREPLRSPSVHIYHADPRRFLKRSGRYDLVLSAMPAPTSGGSNRFFTRCYFQQCARKLTQKGVLALRLEASENVWTHFLAYRNASIYRALRAVFEHVVVLPGEVNIVIAANVPLMQDVAGLKQRFRDSAVDTRFVSGAYIDYLYTNDRFAEIARRLKTAQAVENTDVRPAGYRYAGMRWLSKFFPNLINRRVFGVADNPGVRRSAYLLLICISTGIIFLSRRKTGMRRVVLSAWAGFFGMVLETLLVLYYQAKSGMLFQNIGLLLMVFMAGLALGALAVPSKAVGSVKRGNCLQSHGGAVLLTGVCALTLLVFLLLTFNVNPGLGGSALLLLATGFLVGGIFGYAAWLACEAPQNSVSPLYAADLVGGCFGSLLASLFLIPFWGMDRSALVLLLLALVSLMLIPVNRRC